MNQLSHGFSNRLNPGHCGSGENWNVRQEYRIGCHSVTHTKGQFRQVSVACPYTGIGFECRRKPKNLKEAHKDENIYELT